MTNDEYIACMDAIREMPLEQQIPAAFVLFGDRTSDIIAPIQRESQRLFVKLEEGISYMHTVAQQAQLVYGGIDELKLDLRDLKQRIEKQDERIDTMLKMVTNFQEAEARIGARIDQLEARVSELEQRT